MNTLTTTLSKCVKQWIKAPEVEKRFDYDNPFRLLPGTFVKFSDGRLILIGDTNENGGACDCCPTFDPWKDDFEYGIPEI